MISSGLCDNLYSREIKSTVVILEQDYVWHAQKSKLIALYSEKLAVSRPQSLARCVC